MPRFEMIRCGEGKDHLMVKKDSELGKWLLLNPEWISRTSNFVKEYVDSVNCVLLEKKKYYDLPEDSPDE